MATNNEQIINDFVKHKPRTLQFLIKNFDIPADELDDIFQDSLMVFYEKIRSGGLDNLKSSLYTYFVGICKNKCFEFLRRRSKTAVMPENTFCAGFLTEKLDAVIALDNEPEIEEQKIQAVQTIVKALPDPCDKVLWGYFRDGFSVKTLAEMYDKTETNIKVTKLRCCERFRKRFNTVLNNILSN